MSNTLVPQNNNTGVDKIEMLSPQVVDMINGFRAKEGDRKVLRHKDFMRSTRKEIEALENAGVEVGGQNILPAEYIDSQGKKRPCYRMNRFWIMQMCNKESALVRFKTQQYIEALENRLKQQQVITAEQITQMINEAVTKQVMVMMNPIIDRLDKIVQGVNTPRSEQLTFDTSDLPYTATNIGKKINRTASVTNKILLQRGILSVKDGSWTLNKQYEDKGWGKTVKGQYRGKTYVRYTEKGMQEIIKILSRSSNQEQIKLF